MELDQTPAWKRLPDGTRSRQSPWVWRGFFMMALIAGGIAVGQFSDRHGLYFLLWLVIALGWFAISMWLWRRHVVWMDSDDATPIPTTTVARGPARTPSKRDLRGGKSARRR